jgi:hypothetical protein
MKSVALRLAPVVLSMATLAWWTVSQVRARPLQVFSYQELLDKSDLVAIATPAGRTTDTNEETFLPGIVSTDVNGKQSRVKCIGVETAFEVAAILKGDKNVRKFVLRHCREAPPGGMNGPTFVFFDPSDPKNPREAYLLFLIREPDGRYAPTGGQTDPGVQAISKLPFFGFETTFRAR